MEIGLADGSSERHTIGLDGAPRLSPARDGRPVALSGRWIRDSLLLDFDQVSRINAYTLWLTPSRDRINVRVRQREATGGLEATFAGRDSR